MAGNEILSNIRSMSFDDSQRNVKRAIFFAGFSVLLVYPLVPLLFYFFPKTAQKMMFLSYTLKSDNLSDLQKNGIKSKGRNFYLKNRKGLRIGLYHIFPMSSTFNFDKTRNTEDNFKDALKSLNDPIILYCHGIFGDRGKEDRINIYNSMTSWNYHVITLDYFGIGDSDGVTNEESCVESIILAVEYLYSLVKNNFFVWGHSSGTSILLRAIAVLYEKKITPLGCFLEGPFNDNYNIVKLDWRYKLYSWIPFIDNILFQSVLTNSLNLEMFSYLQKVNCPIQIFHSNSNSMVSKEYYEDLYHYIKNANRDIDVKIFHEYLEDSNIFNAKNLEELVAKFESKCLSKRANQDK
uniref:Lysophosphatidylserine lipase ABHD12 n=1 Tax=Strongyloides papillosus TaxID=174720 RepID=A0A0N5B3Y2_STREA